jgi:hypothetical protein
MLAVTGVQELWQWKERLDQEQVMNSVFIEPDVGDLATAIAALPAEGGLFGDLPLL